MTKPKHKPETSELLGLMLEDKNFRKLLHNHVVEILQELTYSEHGGLIRSAALDLEMETSGTGPDGWPDPAGGLCRHIGVLLVIHELQLALEREAAVDAAWAIHEGHLKGDVAKALGRDSSNLYRRSDMGRDIGKLLDAYDRLDHQQFSRDVARDENGNPIERVTLHDGYIYEAAMPKVRRDGDDD